MTRPEAAAHLGVSMNTIGNYAKAAGVKLTRDLPEEVKTRRKRLMAECRGMTRPEAAAYFGVSMKTIGSDCKVLGIKLPRERSVSVEVKARRKRLVEECLPQGMTRNEAAAHLGVSNAQTITDDCKVLGIKLRRKTRTEAETKRWLEAAPGLASQGLSKSEAAREMGVAPSAFSIAVNRHLPDLKWKCGSPLNAQDQRFVCSVPKLAIAGKTKAGAAVALGMDLPAFESKLAALAKYLPDIVWVDGANGWSVTH